MPPLFCDTDLARRIERAETKFITASTEAAQRRTGGAGLLIPLTDGVEFGTWLEIVLDAVAHPDTEGLPWLEEFPRDVLENAERDFAAAGARHYLALVDRGPAGAASMGIEDGFAQFSAGTAPAFRRRGVQSALLAARVADATAAGCELALVTVQPGSRSQRNVQRRGFDLLYTRATLVR